MIDTPNDVSPYLKKLQKVWWSDVKTIKTNAQLQDQGDNVVQMFSWSVISVFTSDRQNLVNPAPACPVTETVIVVWFGKNKS